MKKLFLLLFLVAALLPASAAYYVAGNGATGNPWCDGKSWNPSGSLMTTADGLSTITFSSVPVGYYRFKVTNGSWNSNWGFAAYNQSESNIYAFGDGDGNVCFETQDAQDLTISFNGSQIALTGSVGNQFPDTTQYGLYGVPSEYEGVMLQLFYWDSNVASVSSAYHSTKWADLTSTGLATDVAKTFDLVWMPPCSYGGGVGYYVKTYSNLNSDWGTEAAMHALIDTLHAYDCKALADVVVNHRQSSNGWTGFTAEDFGEYGQFQITSEHLCAGDEAFTASNSDSKTKPHGAADTGDNDGGCRDLDHTSTYVQDYIKAYTQWLLNTVGYDGFRYDMVKGYSGQYLSLYNQTANPFFSVAEYWDSAEAILAYLAMASFNTTAFDFPFKFTLNDWKGIYYNKLRNPGLRAKGKTKYAVTFIDNHDTFHRSDNQGSEFLGYNTNLRNKRREVLQANAYLLMMPGTPCVFWPHWYTYSAEIKQLVALRKAAGIHSESAVSDETATTNAYSATVAGKNGNIVLRMGSDRDTNAPTGYTLAITGPQMEIYVSDGINFTPAVITAVSEAAAGMEVNKYMENGRLVIIRDGVRYDCLGRKL